MPTSNLALPQLVKKGLITVLFKVTHSVNGRFRIKNPGSLLFSSYHIVFIKQKKTKPLTSGIIYFTQITEDMHSLIILTNSVLANSTSLKG